MCGGMMDTNNDIFSFGDLNWVNRADADFKKRMGELQPANRIFQDLNKDLDKNSYGQK